MSGLDRRLLLFALPVLAVVLLTVVSARGPSGAPELPAAPPTSAGTKSAGNGPVGATPLPMPSKVPDGVTVTAPDYGDHPSPELTAARNRSATIKAYRTAQALVVDQVKTGSSRAPGLATPGLPASGVPSRPSGAPSAGVDTTVAAGDVGGGLPAGAFLMLVGSVLAIAAVGAWGFRRRPSRELAT